MASAWSAGRFRDSGAIDRDSQSVPAHADHSAQTRARFDVACPRESVLQTARVRATCCGDGIGRRFARYHASYRGGQGASRSSVASTRRAGSTDASPGPDPLSTSTHDGALSTRAQPRGIASRGSAFPADADGTFAGNRHASAVPRCRFLAFARISANRRSAALSGGSMPFARRSPRMISTESASRCSETATPAAWQRASGNPRSRARASDAAAPARLTRSRAEHFRLWLACVIPTPANSSRL
jgi:hypothetical protein